MSETSVSLISVAVTQKLGKLWVNKYRQQLRSKDAASEKTAGPNTSAPSARADHRMEDVLIRPLDPELLFSQRELEAYASDLLSRYQGYITLCELGTLPEGADTALMKFFNCIMNCGTPHDISNAYYDYYKTAKYPYRKAVSFGWKPFQDSINQPLAQLTEITKCYVGQTLLVSLLHHRQHIRLFDDWRDVRTTILSTTCRILQDRNPKSWKAMTQLRNEFIVCCRDVHRILLRSRCQQLRILNYAIFENPQKAWDESVETIAEDLQNNKLPSTLNRFVSILVQQWAKMRGSKENEENPEQMARFIDDLHRWTKAAFDQGLAYAPQVKRFIELVWPKWKTTVYPGDSQIDFPGNPMKFIDIRPLMDQFIQPTSELDLKLSRKLMEYISTEASEVYKRVDITVMAAVMSAAFELMDWSNDRNVGILKNSPTQTPLGSPLNIPDKETRLHRCSLQRLSDGVIYQEAMKFWLYSCSFLFFPKIVMKIIPFEDIIRFSELGFERLDEQLEQLEKILPQVKIHRTKTRQVVINALYHIHLGYLKTESATKSFIGYHEPGRFVHLRVALDRENEAADIIWFALLIMNEIKKLAKACDIKWPEDISSGDTFQINIGSSKRKVQTPEKDTSKNRNTFKRQKSEKSLITQPTTFTMNQSLSSSPSLQELDIEVDDELSDGSRSGDTSPYYDQIPHRDLPESNASATTGPSSIPASTFETNVATANSDKASPCRFCGKILSTQTNRNRHENSTHGEKVKCELCGREGRWRSDYIKKHREACERRRNQEIAVAKTAKKEPEDPEMGKV